MTTAGRHARQSGRSLARAVLACVACASAAGIIAGLASVATAPAVLPVPQALVHAPARSAHRVTVHPREAHKRSERVVALVVTVRAGQCLWTIAQAHHVWWVALYRANRAVVDANPDLIYAGMRLRIPAPNYAPRSKR